MILPTKGLEPERALLSVGADVIAMLDEPKTVSRVWDEVRSARSKGGSSTLLTFDWFVLSLDMLFVVRAIELVNGRLRRHEQ